MWTDDAGTMAYDTARTRWPKGVQNMVDDLSKSAAEAESDDAAREAHSLVRRLSMLRASIERDEILQWVLGEAIC